MIALVQFLLVKISPVMFFKYQMSSHIDEISMMCYIDINKELVIKMLKKLKLNKAPGVDGLVTKMLIEQQIILVNPCV